MSTIRIEFEDELQDLTHLIVNAEGYVLEAGRKGADTSYRAMQVPGYADLKPGDRITLLPSRHSMCNIEVPIRYAVESIKKL